jgi:hypothetical protein
MFNRAVSNHVSTTPGNMTQAEFAKVMFPSSSPAQNDSSNKRATSAGQTTLSTFSRNTPTASQPALHRAGASELNKLQKATQFSNSSINLSSTSRPQFARPPFKPPTISQSGSIVSNSGLSTISGGMFFDEDDFEDDLDIDLDASQELPKPIGASRPKATPLAKIGDKTPTRTQQLQEVVDLTQESWSSSPAAHFQPKNRPEQYEASALSTLKRPSPEAAIDNRPMKQPRKLPNWNRREPPPPKTPVSTSSGNPARGTAGTDQTETL